MPGLFGDLVESLPACMDRLQQAARDKSIKGVILHIDGVEIGWARLNELQSAIAEVKAAGKPIWARMNDGRNKDYLLAASCDRILMPESGTLMLTGLRAEVMFYKNLFEMFDVKADMLRVGAFKSAAEPYTRSEMSPEFRKEMEEILDDYYASMVTQIAAARKLPEDNVKTIIDEGLLSTARAKELGLIDDVAYHDQVSDLIAAVTHHWTCGFAKTIEKRKRARNWICFRSWNCSPADHHNLPALNHALPYCDWKVRLFPATVR